MNNIVSISPIYGDYLAHHGIKNQKWGVMHGPPYPLVRGKGGRLPAIKKMRADAKRRREEKKQEKKAMTAAEKKEKLKQFVISHPSSLYKSKDMFTHDELEEIINAINFDQKLKDIQRDQLKKHTETLTNMAKSVASIKTAASSAVDIYKSARDIYSILQGKGTFSEAQDRKKESGSKSDSSSSKPKEETTSESAGRDNSSKESVPNVIKGIYNRGLQNSSSMDFDSKMLSFLATDTRINKKK